MTAKFQLVIDCRDPPKLCAFWGAALGYEVPPPPPGFANWDAYWADVGIPEEDQQPSPDRLVDPTSRGPAIWFQVVDEPKAGKNRIHLDLAVSGGRSSPIDVRKQRVEAEADRLVRLGARRLEPFDFGEGVDHYAVAMCDPEGNEFDIN